MKKLSLVLVAVLILLSLSACGNGTEDGLSNPPAGVSGTQPVSEETTQSDDVFINIKKDLLDIEMFKESLAEYEGIVFTENETFLNMQMSSKTYDYLVENENSETIEAYNSMLTAEGTYIVSMDYDVNFREINVYVDKAVYDSAERNAIYEAINIASPALAYQMFLPNGQQTTVNLMDSETEEVIGTCTLPMSFE